MSNQTTEQKKKEIAMAKEVFQAWDTKLRRYLMFDEFSENIIGIGLAPDCEFVRKIFDAIKGNNTMDPDCLEQHEFLKIFKTSRFA